MKYIRIAVVVLFLCSFVGYFSLNLYSKRNADTTAPVITCETDAIEVSVEDPDEKLLEGVTASDDKDGDLTDEIVMENIGPFLSDGSRRITYVVCDDANNTAHAARTLTYSDYKSPRFSVSDQLRFPEGKELDILEYLTAKDVLDGNLTNRIRCTYGSLYSEPDAGNYEMGYQVSNSAGDVANIDLTVEIYKEEDENYVPSIHLSKYVVYIKKGKSFNPYQYLKEVAIGSRTFKIVTSSDEESAKEGTKVSGLFGDLSNKDAEDTVVAALFYNDIYVDNQVDTSKTGTYKVVYEINTEDGYKGTTGLSVIVYE